MSLAKTVAPGERALVAASASATALGVLGALSLSHMLNDMVQSVAPALFPVFRAEYGLTFFETGLIAFVFQGTASLLQPAIGLYTDRRPMPAALPAAMGATLLGIVSLALSQGYLALLVSVALIGVGSAVFHPEASRTARMASGGRHGFAQSLFQLGGNFGQAVGPLLAAFIVVPFGQRSALSFAVLAVATMAILWRVSRWRVANVPLTRPSTVARATSVSEAQRRIVRRSLAILVLLVFSKTVYIASLSSYYTFYLIDTFHASVQQSQVLLFVFLAANAAGTFAGGPIGDRFGRKFVIWFSILGVLPFTLALPHLGFVATVIDTVFIGLILASAFSAIVVYAQELAPGNVGAIAGLFFGLSFGLGGVGAAGLGALADATSLRFVYEICSCLPAIGLLTYFLPDVRGRRL